MFGWNEFKFIKDNSKLSELLKNEEFKKFKYESGLNNFFKTFLQIFFQKTEKYIVFEQFKIISKFFIFNLFSSIKS